MAILGKKSDLGKELQPATTTSPHHLFLSGKANYVYLSSTTNTTSCTPDICLWYEIGICFEGTIVTTLSDAITPTPSGYSYTVFTSTDEDQSDACSGASETNHLKYNSCKGSNGASAIISNRTGSIVYLCISLSSSSCKDFSTCSWEELNQCDQGTKITSGAVAVAAAPLAAVAVLAVVSLLL